MALKLFFVCARTNKRHHHQEDCRNVSKVQRYEVTNVVEKQHKCCGEDVPLLIQFAAAGVRARGAAAPFAPVPPGPGPSLPSRGHPAVTGVVITLDVQAAQ